MHAYFIVKLMQIYMTTAFQCLPNSYIGVALRSCPHNWPKPKFALRIIIPTVKCLEIDAKKQLSVCTSVVKLKTFEDDGLQDDCPIATKYRTMQ